MGRIEALNIISFNIPYPPNYGGIIDVFYKIKALHSQGIAIYLHCFCNTPSIPEPLAAITQAVYLYPKVTSLSKLFNKKPLSVASREHSSLVNHLKKNKAPILFEGLQTTAMLDALSSLNRPLYLRLHNNEHLYYKGLAKSEKQPLKKALYLLESYKYALYQKEILPRFDAVFCLSHKELDFATKHNPNAFMLPIFHGNKWQPTIPPHEPYFLFHSDLSTADNKKALYEVLSVFKMLPDKTLIIASDRASTGIKKDLAQYPNVALVPIKTHENLLHLIQSAHANILWSMQPTGTKVKLFNTLYHSNRVIINPNITDDKALIQLCHLVENKETLKTLISNFNTIPPTSIAEKTSILEKFSDAQTILAFINTLHQLS